MRLIYDVSQSVYVRMGLVISSFIYKYALFIMYLFLCVLVIDSTCFISCSVFYMPAIAHIDFWKDW